MMHPSAKGSLVIPRVLAALLDAARFVLSTRRRQLLALASLSTLASLYLAEIALGCAAHARALAVSREKSAGQAHRSRAELLDDLRRSGADAWPAFHPYLLLPSGGLGAEGETLLPLGGISTSRTVYCDEGEGTVVFDSDENGFNNPAGLHRAGESTVALIGDSFVEGACVWPGDDVASRLRASGVKALSLGSSGDGPLLELATLVEYARPLEPRVVLWFYYEGNDLLDLESEKKLPSLLRYLESDAGTGLAGKQAVVDALLKGFIAQESAPAREEGVVSAAILRALKLSELRSRLDMIGYPAPSPLFRALLARAKQVTEAWGGALYFVYLPEWSRYRAGKPNPSPAHHSYGRVLSIVHDLSVPVIDFQETAGEEADPRALFPSGQPGHYNVRGYALLASTIEERLKRDRAEPSLLAGRTALPRPGPGEGPR